MTRHEMIGPMLDRIKDWHRDELVRNATYYQKLRLEKLSDDEIRKEYEYVFAPTKGRGD